MRTFFFLLLSIALCVARPARADDKAERTKKSDAFWLEGNKAHDMGRFDEAVTWFERAYQISEDPELLHNMAQAHRQAGRYERAFFFYNAYLRKKKTGGQHTEQAQKWADEMQKLIEDQKKAQPQPPPGVVAPANAGGAAAPATAPAASKSAAGARAKRPWYKNKWGWVGVGAGVLAFGAGGAYFVSADGLRDDIPRVTFEAERVRLRKDADGRGKMGLSLVVAGGAALAAGVVLFAVNPGASIEPTGARVSFDVTPEHAGIIIFGRF